MAYGAFTTYAPGQPSSYTMGNLSASLEGGYLTALLGSVKLSATAALVATVFGLLLAQAIVTSRFEMLRHVVLSASGRAGQLRRRPAGLRLRRHPRQRRRADHPAAPGPSGLEPLQLLRA